MGKYRKRVPWIAALPFRVTSEEEELLRSDDKTAAQKLQRICEKNGPGAARDLAGVYLKIKNNHNTNWNVARIFVQCTSMIVECRIAAKDYDAAAVLLNASLAIYPRSPLLQRNFAYLELKRGNKLKAEGHAAQACAIDPDDARATVLYADILRYNGQPEKAFEFLYSRACQKFNHGVMRGMRRLVAFAEIGRAEYEALVTQYYTCGTIGQKMAEKLNIRHEARRADSREITHVKRRLDPLNLRRGAEERSQHI